MANYKSNSEMNYDRFPTNLCEMFGKIPKKNIEFTFSKIEIWFSGQCVFEKEKTGKLSGEIKNGNISFVLNNDSFSDYIQSSFEFKEISTTSNRIVWSMDIMNTLDLTYSDLQPHLVSLFFIDGELVKAAFNIANQNTMVELYL
jgi:hypothetical protein